MKTIPSVFKYDSSASSYDETSKIVCGARELHRNYFEILLRLIKSSQKSFLDLGCGTGYFTEAILEIYPGISGILIDGSGKMLSVAKEKFKTNSNLTFTVSLFENITWDEIPAMDIIFSSLALHHLEDHEKWKLFTNVHRRLNKDGVFIYFDIFRQEDPVSEKIIEFLSCYDIKNRLESRINKEMDIKKIIENDRKIKMEEGDRETSLSMTLEKLEMAGFHHITSIFQDARYAGIIAYRDRLSV